MTDEEIKQNAARHYEHTINNDARYRFACECYCTGAHSRDEEIEHYRRIATVYKIDAQDTAEECEMLHDIIDKLRNPWHQVNDQMPEDNKKILFRKKDGTKYYGWFSERMQRFFTIDPDHTKWTINGVTHWMPIPELL